MSAIKVRNESSTSIEVHVSTHDAGARMFSFLHGGNSFHTLGMQSEASWSRSEFYGDHCVTVKYKGRDYEVHSTKVGANLLVTDLGVLDADDQKGKPKVQFETVTLATRGNTCPANNGKAHEFERIQFDDVEVDTLQLDNHKLQSGAENNMSFGINAAAKGSLGTGDKNAAAAGGSIEGSGGLYSGKAEGHVSKEGESTYNAGGDASAGLNMGKNDTQHRAQEGEGRRVDRVRGTASVAFICKKCGEQRQLWVQK